MQGAQGVENPHAAAAAAFIDNITTPTMPSEKVVPSPVPLRQ
jgi:hypothetical protein